MRGQSGSEPMGGYPDAGMLPAAELEDYTLPFLAHVVQTFVVIEQTGDMESDLLVDGPRCCVRRASVTDASACASDGPIAEKTGCSPGALRLWLRRT